MRGAVPVVVAAGLLAVAGFAFADEPVVIGEVVADPDTYHFSLVSMEGTVRQVTQLPPYTPGPDTTCYGAYTFMLEDASGSIEVNVLGICGKPFLRTPEVNDGDRILLKAQILSPNHLTSASQGEVKRLRAIANSITHLSPVAPPSENPAPGQAEAPANPDGDGRQEKDGGN
jgi:hypothetical protein